MSDTAPNAAAHLALPSLSLAFLSLLEKVGASLFSLFLCLLLVDLQG